MASLERIGVSLDRDLLDEFDSLISSQGYKSRSEAIRDLVRRQLSEERLGNPEASAVAAVLLVYDHHATNLAEKLIGLQHSHLLQTISSVHVHLGRHDCLEVIILRGQVAEINRVGQKMLSMKGVKLGKVELMATED